jgi:hypothetical protein
MISPNRVELLKQTATYYRTRNKSSKLKKQIEFIQKKLNQNKPQSK